MQIDLSIIPQFKLFDHPQDGTEDTLLDGHGICVFTTKAVDPEQEHWLPSFQNSAIQAVEHLSGRSLEVELSGAGEAAALFRTIDLVASVVVEMIAHLSGTGVQEGELGILFRTIDLVASVVVEWPTHLACAEEFVQGRYFRVEPEVVHLESQQNVAQVDRLGTEDLEVGFGLR